MEEPAQADSIDLEDSKVQWYPIKMSKKIIKEVSIKISHLNDTYISILIMRN